MILLTSIFDRVTEFYSVVELRTLSGVELWRDESGGVVYGAGNLVVVFKVVVAGEVRAMRCYRSHRERLSQIYGDRYYPKELQVGDFWCDVVLCEWIEGRTLLEVVRGGEVAMARLSDEFNHLALEILEREDWAHGDLSASNIIVGEDCRMQTIDHDGCCVESILGLRCEEVGTPSYLSPYGRCDSLSFDMDDFAIAIIMLSLRALAYGVELDSSREELLLLDSERIGMGDYELLDWVAAVMLTRRDFGMWRVAKVIRERNFLEGELLGLLKYILGDDRVARGECELFMEQGLWGFRTRGGGEVVIPAIFDDVREVDGGGCYAELGGRWCRVDVGECCEIKK